MKTLLVWLTLLTASLLHGCASPLPSKQETYPLMYEEKPGVILVVPAINQSTAAEATDYLAATLAQPITMAGYYVLPIELTTQVLREKRHSGWHSAFSGSAGIFRTAFRC